MRSKRRSRKRGGGTDGKSAGHPSVPTYKSYGFPDGANSPSSAAAAIGTTSNTQQNALNKQHGGTGTGSQPKTIPVVTTGSSAATPEGNDANTLSLTTNLVQAQNDSAGDKVPSGGSIRKSRRRTRCRCPKSCRCSHCKRQKSRRRRGGRTVKWGCSSGGRRKSRRRKRSRRSKYKSRRRN